MPHVIEPATTGRATCRGCRAAIAVDSLRVGEAVPNLYAEKDGAETMHWYHPVCASYRRPEAFLEAVASSDMTLPDRDALAAAAARGVAHHRLARIDRAERAPSARASCRACRQPIPKGHWRIALLFWQDGRFAPAGFIHAACAAAYFETAEVLDRLQHFTPDLTSTDLESLVLAVTASPSPAT